MTDPVRRRNRLYKDPNDKMIAGVASGVAKYFDVDTTLVRVVWLVFALSGFGIVLYLVLWLVLDDEPEDLEGPPITTAEAGQDAEPNPGEADMTRPPANGPLGGPTP